MDDQMPRALLLSQRLLVLFLIGLLLLFSPLVSRFDTLEAPWIWWPPILIHVFLVWAALIALAAWTLRKS
jgi:hypothetical protein